MFLKNSFYLFLIPLWVFLSQVSFYDKVSVPTHLNQEVKKDIQLQTLKVMDTFQIEQGNTTYFYRVLDKYYVKEIDSYRNEDSIVYFSTTIDNHLHLVIKAMNTGKLVKN